MYQHSVILLFLNFTVYQSEATKNMMPENLQEIIRCKRNSSALNGNRVTWEVFPMAFLLEDSPMVAESRVINVWAFVLSGMILLGLIILLVVKSLKR